MKKYHVQLKVHKRCIVKVKDMINICVTLVVVSLMKNLKILQTSVK